MLICSAAAVAQTATTQAETAAGPLEIHVTAVQGGAQYRLSDKEKWRLLKADIDLAEGAELRTGPKGAIQFTVGTDQVYRVDRLTAVKVLRADLLPDGTIKTDVGMTYGRVSKDVDAAERPHDDTIVSPSSALAVRGTRVSLYDQPPYEPEAVSLTGAAVFRNLRGELVQFGAKGEGTAKVASDSTSAADYQIQNTTVDPSGAFAGRNAAEQQLVQTLGGNLPGIFQQLIVGQAQSDFVSLVGAIGGHVGELQFAMLWNGSTPFTVVDYQVEAPNGELVSPTTPGSQLVNVHGVQMSVPLATPSGGFYFTADGESETANSQGAGFQEIGWAKGLGGNLPGTQATTLGTFPTGTYTVTETLKGTSTQTLAQNPSVQVTTDTFLLQTRKIGSPTSAAEATTVLNASNPSVVYTIGAPVKNGSPFMKH
jgi:hypothetical protein